MKNGTIFDRFKKSYRINKKSGCWTWIGNFTVSGYGRMMFDYVTYRAHRLSYLIHIGEIPEDMVICHKCDNKKCVNPEHLFVGTIQDNVKDCLKKGRTAANEKNGRCKLTNLQVKDIRKMKGSFYSIAKLYGVCGSTIARIKRRKLRKGV